MKYGKFPICRALVHFCNQEMAIKPSTLRTCCWVGESLNFFFLALGKFYSHGQEYHAGESFILVEVRLTPATFSLPLAVLPSGIASWCVLPVFASTYCCIIRNGGHMHNDPTELAMRHLCATCYTEDVAGWGGGNCDKLSFRWYGGNFKMALTNS